ncbi:MAG: hypothetical protein Q8R76_10520 [Candidatus Omnitrophota bacterium]|nr:hypothetical protein [Candidatus Omnitrophota bacterium]
MTKLFPLSIKLFISLMLCVAGLAYVTLIASIWSDTGLSISVIAEAYGSMEPIEFIQHSFRYMFWFTGIFVMTAVPFFLTAYPEKLKRAVAVVIPLLIVSDIGSAWLIRYHAFFAWQLSVTGALLAACFLLMFSLIQYDLWS